MITVHAIADVQSFVSSKKESGKKIGFVPTMGALHAGHLSLVEASKKNDAMTVMSIFVNPAQFAPNEDFSKYPRSIERDAEMARESGVDLLFLPEKETIYPASGSTELIEPPAYLNNVLCGAHRPGHFMGVCTVVKKFLDIIQPDHLYLGQKDAQQLRILQEMVQRLHSSVKIIAVPTLREPNGLAMSSRNQYLSKEEKNQATIIYKSLFAAKKLFDSGEINTEKILEQARKILESEPYFKIQYLELRTWKDFKTEPLIQEPSLLAVAGYVGITRLIDNVMLKM